ncbi:MAG: hypothetical protein Q7J31_15660 [Syntrophales bacterium]|uniref:hypothetical protein n=1 Tax=Candidatus Wunengus sp. YC61 TaxID=3367698 RepID=UPI00271D3B4F|nr:hypothetical protein [Syntrophales bacterium]
MKRVMFVAVFVAVLLPTFSFASDIEGYQRERNITEGTICISLLSSNTEESKNISTNEGVRWPIWMERSGCCSWHGGVCGCQNGRALCCDGTLSPSCGCN